jgi:orotate phosphoribosyltransferase
VLGHRRTRSPPTGTVPHARCDDPAVLLIDDPWTTGGNAQSAALALRAAGAVTVAIGRHFDRGFPNCEAYYQQVKALKFTWDTCCLEVGAADDAG